MDEFLVEWSINLQAEGPIDAAQQALGIQRDSYSIATVFFVTDYAGNRFRIDVTPEGDRDMEPTIEEVTR